MNRLSLTDRYGEKVIFESKEEMDIANYMFDNSYYSVSFFSMVGSSFKLYLDDGRILKDQKILSFIDENLPEKTNKYKESLHSDKGFFKKKLIKMGLVDETAIKYIKKKL